MVRSPRVLQLEGIFDLPPGAGSSQSWSVRLPLSERPWNIGLVVGPSGCGKTTLKNALWPHAAGADFKWPRDRSLLDGFPAALDTAEIVGLLSSVGFSSPPSWLRPFAKLSNGEQFRATLARALAEGGAEPVVVDEFTSVVDRTVARVGSAAVAKTVRRRRQQFVGVGCHYDVEEWLQPDRIFEPAANAFRWRTVRPRPGIKLEVRRCRHAEWRLFRHHHYLSGDLHPAAQCWLGLVDGRPAAFAAALYFPHPHRSGWREHRLVCLPDFQGVGIGNAFSEFVAACYGATGRVYRSTTSSPAMVRHRAASADWRMTRRPGSVPAHHGGLGYASSTNRQTASFEFVGFARIDEARRFGLPCRRSA